MYGGCLLCPFYPLLFFMPRERDYVIIWNTFFEPSILLQSRSARGWGSWSLTNAPFLKKIRHPAIFFHIAFPNSSFVSINKKQTNKQGTLYSLVWKVTKLNTHPVDSHLQFKRMISRIHSIQAKTFRTLYLNFGESRFQGNFAILFPVKKFCVFPNIPKIPFKTLFNSHLSELSIVWRWGSELASWVNLDCKIVCIFI